MTKVTHEFDLYGKHYTLEAGELAKQATGACIVKCGDSTVLLTAVVSKERKDYDFFPLTVDFIEKMYAVGRVPGGYLKREARPSEKATLTARMIDRPLRPSFPDGFRNEVQIVATSLVADQVNAVDTISVMGASAALAVGGVPFEGPLACVRIGRNVDTGEFLVNPTYEERDHSDLDLELGGSSTFPKRICSPLWHLVRRQLQPSARSRRSLLLSGKRLTALSSSASTSLTSQSLRSMTASLLTMTR